MNLKFSKYHGCGNDFIMIDNRAGEFGEISVKKIQDLCDRHTGIGADGIILVEQTPEADFRMRYFNALLGDETMCGNGARCVVAFAHELGIIKDKAIFLANDGIHEGEILGDGNVSISMADVVQLEKYKNGFICDTGCPHYVEVREQIENLDLIPFAKEIRYSKDFPEGINVNIVEIDDGIKMRTYERGVEDETLACGTGAVAVAVSLAGDMTEGEEREFSIKARGGDLRVRLTKRGSGFQNVSLAGPAVRSFEGGVVC